VEPLRVRFPSLFQKSLDTDISIAQAYTDDGWRIPFHRNLDQNDVQAWRELCSVVEELDLEDTSDRISWSLEPSGSFSSRSLYLAICKRPEVHLIKYLWSYALPLQIKIFTWLARGRLPSNDQILSRNGPSKGNCALCGDLEHVDHIFFQCTLAQFLCSGVCEMFRVEWNPDACGGVIFSPSSWGPQEEGMMSIAARFFPQLRNQGLSFRRGADK
jgi:hypothetical protein